MGNPSQQRVDASIPEDVRPLSLELQNRAQKLLQEGFGPVPERQILGLSPLEQTDLAALRTALGTTSPELGAAQNLTTRTLEGEFLDPSTNPALQASLDAITNRFNQALSPRLDEISGQFAGAGAGTGSAVANARTRATLASGQVLGNELAEQVFGNLQRERSLQTALAPFALTLSREPLGRLQAALNLGGFERGIEQAQQDVEIENFLRRVQVEQIPFQIAVSALRGIPLATPQFLQSELSQNLALAQSSLGLVSTAAGIGVNPGGFSKPPTK